MNHEEADTRIFLHLEDAVKAGYNKVLICTVDTDVVVLAVASVQRLSDVELWITFGTGMSFLSLPVHELVHALTSAVHCLPMFHTFTQFDIHSYHHQYLVQII